MLSLALMQDSTDIIYHHLNADVLLSVILALPVGLGFPMCHWWAGEKTP